MKYFKQVSKRSFAMLLVLVMSLGLLQTTAFAIEPPDTEASNTAVSDANNNEGSSSYLPFVPPTGPSNSAEFSDTDESVNSVEPAAVPARVQVFLNAVNALPNSIVTAEDYDVVEAAMEEIVPLWQALEIEDYDYPSVDEAQMKLICLQEQLGLGRPDPLALINISVAKVSIQQTTGPISYDSLFRWGGLWYNGNHGTFSVNGTATADKRLLTHVALPVLSNGPTTYIPRTYTYRVQNINDPNNIIERIYGSVGYGTVPNWSGQYEGFQTNVLTTGKGSGTATFEIVLGYYFAYLDVDCVRTLKFTITQNSNLDYDGEHWARVPNTDCPEDSTELGFTIYDETTENYMDIRNVHITRDDVGSKAKFTPEVITDNGVKVAQVNVQGIETTSGSLPVYLTYEYYGSKDGVNYEWRTRTEKINVTVYAPDTVDLMAGVESERQFFGGRADEVEEVSATPESVATVKHSGTSARYTVTGIADGSAKVRAKYGYFSGSNNDQLHVFVDVVNVDVDAATTYTVYHEYYTNGQWTGATKGATVNGTVGQVVQVSDLTKNYTYADNTYTYTQANKGNAATGGPVDYTLGEKITQLTLAESGNIIVLRYDRTTYTVQWIDAANNVALKTETRTAKVPVGDTVAVTGDDKSYDGYTYVGDDYEVEGKKLNVLSATLAADGSTVLKMFFTKNPDPTYTLTYHENAGEDTVANMPVPNPDSAAITADSDSHDFNVSTTMPTRTGYTFTGWNTAADGTGTSYTISTAEDGTVSATPATITATKDNKDLHLYAQWNKNPEPTTAIYTVQWLDATNNGAELKSETRPGNVGDTVAVDEADKSYPGYTFDEDNENNVLSTVLAESGTVLKLYFTKNSDPTYTVTYTWTGLPAGTTAPAVPDAASYTAGAEVTMDTRAAGDLATVGGVTFQFSGWTVPDTVTVTDNKFAMPEENVTITGKWQVATTYKVEWYDAARKQIKTSETRYGIAGEMAAVTEDDKVVDGYVFAAKSTSNILQKEIAADGSTVLKLYFNAESLTVTKTAFKRVEKDGCYVDYTVTLKNNLAKPQYFIQLRDVMDRGLSFVTNEDDEDGSLANLTYTLRKTDGTTYSADFGSWRAFQEDNAENTVAYICFQLDAKNGYFENGDALVVKYTAKADTPITDVTQYHNHVYATTWNAN